MPLRRSLRWQHHQRQGWRRYDHGRRRGSDIRDGRGNDVIDAANDLGDAINCGRDKDQVTYDDGPDLIEKCKTLIATAP